MNKTVKQSIATVGLMMAAAAGSFAQNLDIAEINFPFRVGKASMPAGEYQVHRDTSGGAGAVLRLFNRDGKKAVLAVPQYNGQHREKPSLTFQCVAVEICSLVAVNTGNGSKWLLPTPKLTAAQMAAVREIVVPMGTTKAD